MAILSVDESQKVRQKQANRTGESALAKSLTKAFSSHDVSRAQHRYEFEGVMGELNIQTDQHKLIGPAVFWYEGKTPRITIKVNGEIKVISLIGRKNQFGSFKKFSVLQSRLKPSGDRWEWLNS